MWTVRNGIQPNDLEKTLNALAAGGLVVRNIFYTAKTFAVVAFRESDSKKTLLELYQTGKKKVAATQ
jgi:hypothetical protein